MYAAIGLQPWLQFSQIRPHFLKKYDINPIKLRNLKKHLDVWVWGLETTFGPLGPRRRIQPLVQNPCSNFYKQDLIFLTIMR